MTTKPTTPPADDRQHLNAVEAALTESPAPEFVITQHVKHVPTGNLGTITGLAPDAQDGHGNPEPLAQVEWTAGGSTGSSMVPLAELVPDGATVTPIKAKTTRKGRTVTAKTGNPVDDRTARADAILAGDAPKTTKAAEREAAKAAKAKLEAALGTEPGNGKDRARYESVNATARKQLRKDAMVLMEAGATKAKAWAGALDDAGIMAATPEPKAAKTPTPRVVREHAGVAVDGYTVRWPHPAYDLLLTTDKTAERDAWLCRCNIHGKTTPVASGKDGDAKGKAAERATWCSGCKRDAAKAASADTTTTAPAAPAADATPAAPAAE